jgi:hypothetical protein
MAKDRGDADKAIPTMRRLMTFRTGGLNRTGSILLLQRFAAKKIIGHRARQHFSG